MENGKIRVCGKSQNRTALGIINAYLVLRPDSTIDGLRMAFPNSLNPDSGVKSNFIDEEQMKAREGGEWKGYFTKDEELIHLTDGSTVALVSMWTKPSLERLINKAAQFGIEAGEYNPADKERLTPAGYLLEYINGFNPDARPAEPKKKGCLGSLLLMIAAGASAGYYLISSLLQ